MPKKRDVAKHGLLLRALFSLQRKRLAHQSNEGDVTRELFQADGLSMQQTIFQLML